MGPYLRHKTFDCGVISKAGLSDDSVALHGCSGRGGSLQLTAAIKMAAFLLQPLLKH